ncbi:hypothetical protein [Tsukamurella paurometabola]|uniref:hypothetical protein n=1 Tax=Tsukamurella paurometabola TaxID=2061 RepID=UPI001BAFFF1F|nr:hypothetical protein [Tsukamurella paurometabola]
MVVLLLLLPLIPLAVSAVVVWLIFTLLGTNRTEPLTPEAQRASRASAVALGFAAVLAVIAAGSLIATDEYGRGIVLAGPVFLLVVQFGLAADTAIISTSVRTKGDVRVAGLSPRKVSDNMPRALAAATLIVVIVALTFVAIASAVASTDDDSGKDIAFASANEYGGVETFSPFPGAFYSVPLAAVLVVSMIVGAGTLVGAGRWGALNQPTMDLALRLGISTRSVAASAMSAGLTLAIVGWMLFAAALQVSGSPDDSTLWRFGTYAFPIAALVGIVVGMWAFLAFLFPMLGRKSANAPIRLQEVRP